MGKNKELLWLRIVGYTNGWPKFEASLEGEKVEITDMNAFLKPYGYHLVPISVSPAKDEVIVLQTCELPKGEKCPYDECKGCDCPLGVYNSFNPKVVSTPTTINLAKKCPECGHPIMTHNKYGCQARYPVCSCSKTRSILEYEQERESHSSPVKMEISSKVPSKWRFVDLETGDIWKWDEEQGTFINAEAKEVLNGLNARK